MIGVGVGIGIAIDKNPEKSTPIPIPTPTPNGAFGQNYNCWAALERMEAGEDPKKIESEMGDLLDEEPFVLPDKKGKRKGMDRRSEPRRDPKLHEM